MSFWEQSLRLSAPRISHLISVSYISKLHAQFHSMEVRNSSFAAYIDLFTSNTYAMVIMSDPEIRKSLSLRKKCSYSELF